jgi:protein-tyrosine-phosphatase
MAAVRRLIESDAARQRRLTNALSTPPGRLVFVCHGNIMRSAFAAAYLRRQHPEHAAHIAGAGTHATDGRAAQASAMLVAQEMGVSLDTHTAQSLKSVGLVESDIVICMDRANEANILAFSEAAAPRVFVIGDVTPGIPASARVVRDPYARGDVATRDAFTLIRENADRWYFNAAKSWSKPS